MLGCPVAAMHRSRIGWHIIQIDDIVRLHIAAVAISGCIAAVIVR